MHVVSSGGEGGVRFCHSVKEEKVDCRLLNYQNQKKGLWKGTDGIRFRGYSFSYKDLRSLKGGQCLFLGINHWRSLKTQDLSQRVSHIHDFFVSWVFKLLE